MKNRLSATQADPFEVYHSVHRDKWFWQITACILFATNLGLGGLLAVVSSRRPYAIIKDRMFGDAPVVTQAEREPPITATDARVFLINMLKLRHGWDSMTVLRDLDAFLKQCHSDQRTFEKAYIEEGIALDAEEPDTKIPRLQHWMASSVKNTLLLPDSLEDVHCEPAGETWSCYVSATVVTQKLFPPFLAHPPTRHSKFVASLLPMKHTLATPSGLAVGILRELPGDVKGS